MYRNDFVRLCAYEWLRAYAAVIEHLLRCGTIHGIDDEEVRQEVSAVMNRWPENATF